MLFTITLEPISDGWKAAVRELPRSEGRGSTACEALEDAHRRSRAALQRLTVPSCAHTKPPLETLDTVFAAALAGCEEPHAVGGPRESATTAAISLLVDDRRYTLNVDPRATLLATLRDRLGVVGIQACDRGECGDCDVEVDGARIHACTALAVAFDQRRITTLAIAGPPSGR